MAEPNKNLPLVVAEILIEMPGMNDRLNCVENVLVQVVDNIQQLPSAVKLAAEQHARQQEINNRNFQLLQETDQRNTQMLAVALQNAIAIVGRRSDNLENCVESLENR